MGLDDQALSDLLRAHATRHAAPDSLRAAIQTETALAEAGRSSARPPAGPVAARGLRRWVGAWRRGAIPLSFALGMLCMALLVPWLPRWAPGEPVEADMVADLEADLVADHVRAMRTGPIAEVISTDRHTVKPWFQGRLDFAPTVLDLAAAGYPLVGGRTGHVRGNPVAALAYTRRLHMIDVFIWPGARHAAPVHSQHRGFQVVHWADGSMQYWAVSDMDAGELDNFARLWRARAAAP